MEPNQQGTQPRETTPHVDQVVEQSVSQPRPEPPRRETHNHGGNGMVEMARENVQMHLAPVPMASDPEIPPFPRALLWGAGGGIAIGALVGLIFGLLLVNGAVVVPGWEQLYSMTPGTFVVFWTGMGGAAGLVLFGVLSVLLVKPQRHAAAAPEEGR